MASRHGILRPLSYVGAAGDRNGLGSQGAAVVGYELGRRLGRRTLAIGTPVVGRTHSWADALAVARPGLVELQHQFDRIVGDGDVPVAALPRCAASLATLPVVAALRPDALLVWFDAHGDLNTPGNTATGYLGGLVLSAAMGWWDSGLGSGLDPERIVLGGARDLDAAERALVDAGTIRLASGPSLLDDLDEYVGTRPLYFHLDCDVLEPGTVPTEYVVPDGLTLLTLARVAERLSRNEIVGIEVAEMQVPAGEGDQTDYVGPLLDALAPMLEADTHA